MMNKIVAVHDENGHVTIQFFPKSPATRKFFVYVTPCVFAAIAIANDLYPSAGLHDVFYFMLGVFLGNHFAFAEFDLD